MEILETSQCLMEIHLHHMPDVWSNGSSFCCDSFEDSYWLMVLNGLNTLPSTVFYALDSVDMRGSVNEGISANGHVCTRCFLKMERGKYQFSKISGYCCDNLIQLHSPCTHTPLRLLRWPTSAGCSHLLTPFAPGWRQSLNDGTSTFHSGSSTHDTVTHRQSNSS